uniref:Uncharacterized protein n=1 Tax=viral metagenome TaxID=1070528 RepID=A0A6C0HT76_9ZZZZ
MSVFRSRVPTPVSKKSLQPRSLQSRSLSKTQGMVVSRNRVSYTFSKNEVYNNLIQNGTIDILVKLDETPESTHLIDRIISLFRKYLDDSEFNLSFTYVLKDVESEFRDFIESTIESTKGGRRTDPNWNRIKESFFRIAGITSENEKEAITNLAEFVDTIKSSWFFWTANASFAVLATTMVVGRAYPYDAGVFMIQFMAWVGYNIGVLICNIAQYQAPSMVTSAAINFYNSPAETKQFIIKLFFTYFGGFFTSFLNIDNLENITNTRNNLSDFRSFQCALGWYLFVKRNLQQVTLSELRATNPEILNTMVVEIAESLSNENEINSDNLTRALNGDEAAIQLISGRFQNEIVNNMPRHGNIRRPGDIFPQPPPQPRPQPPPSPDSPVLRRSPRGSPRGSPGSRRGGKSKRGKKTKRRNRSIRKR